MPTSRDLSALATHLRTLPSVEAKASIGQVTEVFGGSDWTSGPGDDGAVITSGDASLVVGGEAMLPAFVAHDPYGAGVSAVLANVNDLVAMGAEPLAVVNTVVGTPDITKQMLQGMKWASGVYDVPIVGGHLTHTDGPPSLSAFGLGRADAVLSATRAEAGHALMLVGCFEGTMRGDFLFFRSFDEREGRIDGDVRLLVDAANRGAAVAAKDVSMAGVIGSLAMLLEPNRLGATVDIDAIPLPAGVDLQDWLSCFPNLVFLVTTPPAQAPALQDLFTARGLGAQRVGTIDDSGVVRLASPGAAADVFDLTTESVTHLGT